MKNIQDPVTLSNGVQIPCMGYGTWRTPAGEETVTAVKNAIECGFRHIDTAQLYGNEESVGEGIRAAGIHRREIFLTTKLKNSDQGYDAALKAFEGSLKRLGVEYVDLYLIHWPVPVMFKDNWQEVSRQTWKAMERLYEEKLIRAIGLSNFLPHHIENITSFANVAPVVDQLEIHPCFTQKETVKYCQEHHIQVQAWSPLGHGSVLQNQTLASIAACHGKTPAQTALRWELQQNIIPISKSMNISRMKENADVFDFELSVEEMDKIFALGEDGRTGPDPDNIDF